MMSKKQYKISKIDYNEIQLKQRHGWIINPKTRVVPSKKLYKRGKSKQKLYKELRDET
jgi:hypothetical protein